jgi:pimeloyl-ACP methyl ester carboxylesterase
MTEPTAFVLVHGAWCGGFIWRGVADRLRAAGHRVFTPTLTGLADRSHLLTPDVDLATHVADVVNLVRWEGLSEIVLVGHSYGGMVINGVAEALARAPDGGVIRSIVFLDAFAPRDGESVSTIAAPMADVFAADAVPFPFAGLTDPAFEALTTPHPGKCFREPARVTGAVEAISARTYVIATGQPTPWFVAAGERLRAAPGWAVRELACGHATMLDMPEETAQLLADAAS